MKTLLIICCASLGLVTAASFAQMNYGTPTADKPTADQSASQAGHSQQFYHSKDLLGAKVNDSQGQRLGKINDLVLNPKSGETLAAVEIERGQHALIPLQALNVTAARGMLRNLEVTVNKTKADLASGPTLKNNEWQKLDDRSFTQHIYSFYNVQEPSSGMGGTREVPGVSTGTSKQNR